MLDEELVETLQELEYEIECPRCNDIMVLSADFDSLWYLCDECKFSLTLYWGNLMEIKWLTG